MSAKLHVKRIITVEYTTNYPNDYTGLSLTDSTEYEYNLAPDDVMAIIAVADAYDMENDGSHITVNFGKPTVVVEHLDE